MDAFSPKLCFFLSEYFITITEKSLIHLRVLIYLVFFFCVQRSNAGTPVCAASILPQPGNTAHLFLNKTKSYHNIWHLFSIAE